jgi:hypothetical protein
MSKNYLMVLLAFLAMFVLSCKHSEEFTKTTAKRSDREKIVLNEVKGWYESQKKGKISRGKTMSVGIKTSSFVSSVEVIGDPNWNVATLYNLADAKEIIKVALTNYDVNFPYSETMNPLGYRELIFEKNSSGEVNGHVLEVHPDVAYLQQQQQTYSTATLTDYAILIKNENFTGFVMTFDLNNSILSGQHKTNGVTDKILYY